MNLGVIPILITGKNLSTVMILDPGKARNITDTAFNLPDFDAFQYVLTIVQPPFMSNLLTCYS